jgi:hypothetical protein
MQREAFLAELAERLGRPRSRVIRSRLGRWGATRAAPQRQFVSAFLLLGADVARLLSK